MAKLAQVASRAQSVGFTIPTDLPDFPLIPRRNLRLTREQEQAFGYTVLQLTLDQMQAFACDRELVSEMLSDIESAFTKDNSAEKAVALVRINGYWVRHGSIPTAEFSALAREKIARVREGLAAMDALDGKERDLFYIGALDALRTALAEVVPYDIILAKTTKSFAQRCSDLSSACRDLVDYAAKEMHLSRPRVQLLCEPFWLSNKLPAICFGANRYVQSIMPAKAKREFRFGILERQQRIAKVAIATGVPIGELLESWSSFYKLHQRIDRLSGVFADHNTGLAEKVARDYQGAQDFDDVRSAANQGLARAIALYAPEKGMKFSTYATTWIKQTILRSLIQQDLIRLPEGSYQLLGRVRAVYADFPNASDEYVRSAANVSALELEGLRPYLLGNGAMSLDTLVSSDGEECGLHGLIADENNDFVTELEEESEAAYVIGFIRKALTEQEYVVLSHRTGLGGVDVLQGMELASRLGISPQTVSLLWKKAQAKIVAIPELKAVWEQMEC